MPPRFAYWTILAGGLPTSFRAAERDELMPTFRRIKEKHPDAEMKYFARGKLWDSPVDARTALEREGRGRGGARTEGSGGDRERRDRNWRPGGDHRDPRQRFRDAKRERNQAQRQQRWQRKHDDRRAGPPQGEKRYGGPPRERPHGAPPREKPHGDPLAPRPDRRAGVHGSRQGQSNRPFVKRNAPRSKPHGEAFRGGAAQRGPRPSAPRSLPARPFERKQETPHQPPPRPDREPPPGREPQPEPPPRPSEPEIKPPGPPERGRVQRPPERGERSGPPERSHPKKDREPRHRRREE